MIFIRKFNSAIDQNVERFVGLPIRHYLIFILLLVISFGIYANTLQNNFVFDDNDLIVNNAYIQNIKLFPQIFITQAHHASTVNKGNYYRPLQILSYAFNYMLGKLVPWGYHLVNIFLHCLCSFLVFLLICALFSNLSLALVVSILYCVHPIHTSVVGYISGRADILVNIFMLAAILQFLVYSNKQKLKNYIFSLVYFVLALLSRENALLLPFFIIFIASVVKIKDKYSLISILGFFIIDIFYLANRIQLGQYLGDISVAGSFVWFYHWLVNFINVLYKYFILIIYPWPLQAIRTTPFINQITVNHVFFIVGCASLVAVAFWQKIFRKDNKLFFSLFWFIIGILPVARLIYYFPSLGAVMAENWLYLPSIGLFAAISYFILSLKRMRWLIFIVLIGIYACLTITTNKIWKDEITLYNHILKFNPTNSIIKLNLANVYLNKKDYLKAKNILEAMVNEKNPQWEALASLGNIYFLNGQLDKALVMTQAAAKLSPKNSYIFFNLGLIYFRQNKYEDARKTFLQSLENNPQFWPAYANLGDLYFTTQLYQEAAKAYQQALEFNPENQELYVRTIMAFINYGAYNEALIAMRRFFLIEPQAVQKIKDVCRISQDEGKLKTVIAIWNDISRQIPQDKVLSKLIKEFN